MNKKNLLILLTGMIFISCSSMPKGEKSQFVQAVRTKSALQLEQGNNEYRWNNYQSALGLYSKAMGSASSVDWQEGVIRSMVQISRTLDQLKRTEEARQYALTASAFKEASESQVLRVLTLNRLAEWEFFNGSSSEALEIIGRAIIAGKGLEREEAGETWRIKAALHKKEKEYPLALEAISRAVSIDKKGAFLAELASDYYIQASIYSLSDKYTEAVATMEKALLKDKFIENSAGIAMDLYGLAKIHEKNGKNEIALEYYKRLYLVYRGSNKGTVPEFLLNSLEPYINGMNNENWIPDFDIP